MPKNNLWITQENNERSDYVFLDPRNPTHWRITWDPSSMSGGGRASL